MAKSNIVKLVELHVEKAVLGLCVLLLAFAVVHWTASSPREFQPASGGQAMEPSEVDKYLVERGRALAEKVRRPDEPDEIVRAQDPEWDKVIQESRQFRAAVIDKPSLGEAPYARVRPAGPVTTPLIPIEEFVKLIPSPAAPRVVSDTVLIHTEKTGDICINGGVGSYPFKQLEDNWNRQESTVVKVPLRVDVDVEETTSDKTVTVKAVEPLIRKTVLPKGTGDSSGSRILPDFVLGKNQEEVFKAIDEFNSDVQQQRILTPDLPSIWDAQIGNWVPGEEMMRTILPESLLPVLPAPVIGPVLPAPVAVGPAPVPAAAKPAPSPAVAKPAARPHGGSAARPAAPVTRPPGVPVARPILTPIAGPGGGGGVLSVPQSRRDADRIYFWWQHANVQPGSAYRYRVRIAFVNPLLARDTVAKNPEEAKVKSVESPWSAWSEPVTVVRPIRFFLVNKVTESQVRVAVFARAMGRWIRQDYTVSQGDPIGRMETQQKVWNPRAGKEQEISVDFSTGTVAMDFAETAVVLPTGRAAVGVEMIYLGDDGRLKAVTNVMADRTAPAFMDYNALEQQVRQESKRLGMGAVQVP